MILGAVSALWGRPELSRLALRHNRPLVDVAVAVVSTDEDASVAVSCGWDVVRCPNEPLGMKHNRGSRALRGRCDAVMNLPSDDFVTADYVEAAKDEIEAGADVVSTHDLYVFDTVSGRLVRLGIGHQAGAGRIVSGNGMEAVGWCPWKDYINSGLDGSIVSRLCRGLGRRLDHRMVSAGFVLDVKTKVNIWSMDDLLEPRRASRSYKWEELDGRWLDEAFSSVAPSLKASGR